MIFLSALIILAFLAYIVIFIIIRNRIGKKDLAKHYLSDVANPDLPDCELKKLGYGGSQGWQDKDGYNFISFNRSSGLIGSETPALICIASFGNVKPHFALLTKDHRYRYLDSVSCPLKEITDSGTSIFCDEEIVDDGTLGFISRINGIASRCSVEFYEGSCILLIDRPFCEKIIDTINASKEIMSFIIGHKIKPHNSSA